MPGAARIDLLSVPQRSSASPPAASTKSRLSRSGPRVPDDLPEVSIGIAEVSRVDPAGPFVRLLGQGCAGGLGPREHGVDLLFARNELAEAEGPGRRIKTGVRVLGEV